MARLLTDSSRSALAHVAAEHRAGRWARARRSGERVSLASLHTRGYVVRRAWRGIDGAPDAAYEYQLTDELLAAVVKRETACPHCGLANVQGRGSKVCPSCGGTVS